MKITKPIWHQQLTKSLHSSRRKAESRYMQLATVSNSGKPENRTVVFRGFDETGENLWFITDSRSDKYTSIQNNPNVEVCWYFSQSREQYRFSGVASFNTNVRDRLDAWDNLSDKGREQFLWGTPKEILDKDNDAYVKVENGLSVTMPDYFQVVNIEVNCLDYLNLSSNCAERPQYREIYKKEKNGWLSHVVIP